MISSKTYIALTKFAIVGGLSFLVDFFIYYSTSQFLPTFVAKSLAIVIATLVNYQMNKRWTWKQSDKSKKRFAKYILLYLISGLTNVSSNELLLMWIPDYEFTLNLWDAHGRVTAETIANLPNRGLEMRNLIFMSVPVKFDKLIAVLGATGVGMVMNFLGQKLWVFTEKRK